MNIIMGPNVIKKYLRARVYFKFWYVLWSDANSTFVVYLAQNIF